MNGPSTIFAHDMGAVQLSESSSEIDDPVENENELSSLDSIEVSDTSSLEDAECILT